MTKFGQAVKEFGPPMWQAEAATKLTLSCLPAKAVSQTLLEYGFMPSLKYGWL